MSAALFGRPSATRQALQFSIAVYNHLRLSAAAILCFPHEAPALNFLRGIPSKVAKRRRRPREAGHLGICSGPILSRGSPANGAIACTAQHGRERCVRGVLGRLVA